MSALSLLSIVGADKYICDRNAELYLSGRLENVDLNVMFEMEPASAPALLKIAQSDTKKAVEAQAILTKLRLNYAYSGYSSLVEGDKVARITAFDNLEQYKAAKIANDFRLIYSDPNESKKAYIYVSEQYLENSSGEEFKIKSLAVTTEKETLCVQNADGSYLEKEKLYTFDIDTKDVRLFTYTIETPLGTYELSKATNFINLQYENEDYVYMVESYGFEQFSKPEVRAILEGYYYGASDMSYVNRK